MQKDLCRLEIFLKLTWKSVGLSLEAENFYVSMVVLLRLENFILKFSELYTTIDPKNI